MDKQKLDDNIWTTRKSRINASERLQKKERFIQCINIYYSCYAAIISIWSLTTTEHNLTFISTVLTVVLSISIVFLNAQKYGDRSQQLKVNYIEMQRLSYELQSIEVGETEKIKEIQDKYCDLLAASENHDIYDYLKLQWEIDKIKTKEAKMYYCYCVINFIVKCSCIAFPIILTVVILSM